MPIEVVEYADIWDPAESASPPGGYPSQEVRVDAFLDCFLDPLFEGKVVVWNTHLLKNRRWLGIPRKMEFARLTLVEAIAKRRHIRKACYSHGHMSVLVAPLRVAEFRTCVLHPGYYRQGVKLQFRDESGLQWPWPVPVTEAEEKMVQEFGAGEVVFTLAHDADSLFEIRCL